MNRYILTNVRLLSRRLWMSIYVVINCAEKHKKIIMYNFLFISYEIIIIFYINFIFYINKEYHIFYYFIYILLIY